MSQEIPTQSETKTETEPITEPTTQTKKGRGRPRLPEEQRKTYGRPKKLCKGCNTQKDRRGHFCSKCYTERELNKNRYALKLKQKQESGDDSLIIFEEDGVIKSRTRLCKICHQAREGRNMAYCSHCVEIIKTMSIEKRNKQTN